MKGNFLLVLKNLILVSILAIILGIVVLFAISFFQVNAVRFSILPIVAFARGWEKLWVWIYLAADAGYLLILGLLFLELSLFLARTIVILSAKALAAVRGTDPERLIKIVKKISLVTPIKKLGVNTPTKSIIAYVAVMLLVLGGGWVAKQILDANESLVYRSIIVKNLESDELVVDVEADIEADETFAIDIAAGVGNVHIYSVSDTTEVTAYFLYDTTTERESLVWSVDADTNVISVRFSETADAYVKYVDPLPGSIELYLPSTLTIGAITVDLAHYGNLTIEYLSFATLVADVAQGTISLSAADRTIGDVLLASRGGVITVKVDACASIQLTLFDHADANLTAGAVTGSLSIVANGEDHEVLVYSSVAAIVSISGSDAQVEVREVYAPDIRIEVVSSRILYVNGDKAYAYGSVTVVQDTSEITLRGVPDDTNG
ncbi:MAG TPA: hypothetical protein DCR44_07515 [Acholeplasmatales bacterium]|nr:MAG: hypothetical protein A2Y16_02085 [Tenericutes bacterium GWF2_57_13]HAQ57222.1 hypothetical protein [Acholeplasmatales bacterium]